MRAVITNVTPWHPSPVRVQWDLEEVSESGSFSFDVERSGSPGGPWTTITSVAIVDAYTYDDAMSDESANTLSLSRDVYYRVKVTPPSGAANAFYSNVVNLDGLSEFEMTDEEPGNPSYPKGVTQFEKDPTTGLYVRPEVDKRKRLLKRHMVRNLYLQLKHLNGVEFKLLKRRHFGTRCTDCYDQVSRMVLKEKCDVCYGTSWVGGFYTPVDMLGRIVRGSYGQVQTNLTSHTVDTVNYPSIQMLDFPRIDPDDVLVAVDQNRRFLVKTRYNTSLKMVQIHQTLTVSELERGSPEYLVAI